MRKTDLHGASDAGQKYFWQSRHFFKWRFRFKQLSCWCLGGHHRETWITALSVSLERGNLVIVVSWWGQFVFPFNWTNLSSGEQSLNWVGYPINNVSGLRHWGIVSYILYNSNCLSHSATAAQSKITNRNKSFNELHF